MEENWSAANAARAFFISAIGRPFCGDLPQILECFVIQVQKMVLQNLPVSFIITRKA